MGIQISKEDLLRSKTVKPGWYRVFVKRVGEGPAKTDGSTKWDVDLVITQEGDYKDVPLRTTFSEKAPGFAVKYLEAFGVEINPAGGNYNLLATAEKSLEVFIDNELYEGRLTNKVKDYRPAAA